MPDLRFTHKNGCTYRSRYPPGLLKCAAEESDPMTDINIDQLVHTAVFGDGDAKAEARRTIHLEARRRGAVSSSIYLLYMAFGRNEIERAFTVPAFNIRALTYDAARALFRVAM